MHNHCHAGQQGCQALTPCALSRICSSASSACEGCTTHCRQHKQLSADSATCGVLQGSGCGAAAVGHRGWAGSVCCTCCSGKAELWQLRGNIPKRAALGCNDCMAAALLLCSLAASRLGSGVLTGCPRALSCKPTIRQWQPGLALHARLQGSSPLP